MDIRLQKTVNFYLMMFQEMRKENKRMKGIIYFFSFEQDNNLLSFSFTLFRKTCKVVVKFILLQQTFRIKSEELGLSKTVKCNLISIKIKYGNVQELLKPKHFSFTF
jgi:hypothetical protein